MVGAPSLCFINHPVLIKPLPQLFMGLEGLEADAAGRGEHADAGVHVVQVPEYLKVLTCAGYLPLIGERSSE